MEHDHTSDNCQECYYTEPPQFADPIEAARLALKDELIRRGMDEVLRVHTREGKEDDHH